MILDFKILSLRFLIDYWWCNTLTRENNWFLNVLVKSNFATPTPFGSISCFVAGVCLSNYNLNSFLIHQASFSKGCQWYLMRREVLGSIWKIGRYPIKVSEVLISDGIFILSPGSCPRGGTLGHWGCPGGQFFFQTWPCGILNRRGWWAEQNASNIFILGSNWWPWGKVKRSNSINMSISKIFIPNSLCVFSQIKDRKLNEQNFHSVARVMPRGGTYGCWGSQKL